MSSPDFNRKTPRLRHLWFWFGLGQRGFSLAELLIVLAISSVVSTTAYSFYIGYIQTYEKQSESVRVQMNVRASLDLLARELRMAGYDPLGTASAGFGPSSRQELAYSADLSGNGVLEPEEQVCLRFYPAEGVIKRKSSSAAGNSFQPMFREIDDLEFRYLLADGGSVNVPAEPALIRAVEIRILGKNSARWGSTIASCRNFAEVAE